MGSRWEVWTHPSTGTFQRKILRLPVVSANMSVKNSSAGGGRIVLPASYAYIHQIIRRDPVNPANDVRSVIRVFDDETADPSLPLLEMVPLHVPDAIDPAGPITISCGSLERSFFRDAVIWAFDHPKWLWPDWIWGGRNVLANPGFEETTTIPARYAADGEATGGNWQITVDGLTANIPIPTTAGAIRAAIEALDPTYEVLVSGMGTVANPWEFEFRVPYHPAVTTNTGGTTGGVIRMVIVAAGFLLPVAWIKSRNPVTGLEHGSYSFWGLDTVPDTGIYALKIDAVDASAFDYPGAQQEPEVIPGGYYQASIRFRPSNTTDPWRFVLRDMKEGIPTGLPDPLEFTGTAPGVYETKSFGTVVIPETMDQMIFRVGYTGGVDPGPIHLDNMELREGLAPATAGEIIRLLHEDCWINHAGDVPPRVALAHITLNFTDTHDSNGNAWDALLSFNVTHGVTFYQVLEALHEQFGYEFWLEWNGTEWDLNLVNSGARGEQNPALNPALVVGLAAVTKGPITYDALSGNAILAEGAERRWARSENTNSISSAGRIETYVPMVNVLDQPTLDLAAAAQLAELLSQGMSISLTLAPGAKPVLLANTANEGLPLGSMTYLTVPGYLNQYPVRLDGVTLDWKAGVATPARVGHFAQESFDEQAGVTEMVRRLAERAAILPPPAPLPRRQADARTGGSAPTLVVAAANSSDSDKARADLVCPGTFDWSFITDAMNRLWATTGRGRLLLTGGDFYLGGGLILYRGIIIEGMGEDATRLHLRTAPVGSSPVTASAMFTVNHSAGVGSTEQITISRLDAHGYKSINTVPAAGFYCAPNGGAVIKLTDVNFHDFKGHGTHFDRCADTVTATRLRSFNNALSGVAIGREGLFKFHNCDIYLNSQHGFDAPGAVITLTGSVIRGNVLDGFSSGGFLQQTGQMIIGNRIYQNRYGIVLNAYECLINDNLVWANTLGGMQLDAVLPNTVDGNSIFDNGGFGASLGGGVGGDFTANVVYGNSHHGIIVPGSAWNVIANDVRNNGAATTNTYDGIRVTGSANDILANVIRESGGNLQRYAIAIVSGTDNRMIGNKARGAFGTGPYLNTGTGTVTTWAGVLGDNQ